MAEMVLFLSAANPVISRLQGFWGSVSDPSVRALEWHSRGKGFDPPHLHFQKGLRVLSASILPNLPISPICAEERDSTQ